MAKHPHFPPGGKLLMVPNKKEVVASGERVVNMKAETISLSCHT